MRKIYFRNLALSYAMLFALIGGCSEHIQPRDLSIDHPASPRAPESPIPAPSSTLAVTQPSGATTRSTGQMPADEPHMHEHAGHGGKP